ncbi:MAG TPA: hypothetical protein VGG46_04060 [Terriglobales bacterium]|jgi:hypothetical protein
MPDKDTLTLTIRIHDPKEKKDAKLAASWVVVEVSREDLKLAPEQFAAKYVTPKLAELEQLKDLP